MEAYEKPVMNIASFDSKLDVIATSGGTAGCGEDCPAYCATHNCPNDTGEFG